MLNANVKQNFCKKKFTWKLRFGKNYSSKLESTARYAGLLLAPAKGFGLWLRVLWQFFYCSVVTVSSNLSNFKNNSKKKKYLLLLKNIFF